ncbi:MAG: zinc-dependent peptidase [Vicinamibacteria bacterium]|nr:zinc-dependent peptidase [Vicinamibacteria bacterium]
MSVAMALFGRKVEVAPLTETDTAFLGEWSQPYATMVGALKAEFEDQVAHFVAQHRMTGIGLEGPLDREDRLLVAASACTLSCGWPGFRWTDVSEVLLYADDFDRDYRVGGDDGGAPELSGQAHPWGTVLISLPSLEDSFEDPHDGFHVGYHEFAHVLDKDSPAASGGAGYGGLPFNIDGPFATEMSKALDAARVALELGDSPLDEYGLQSPAELWAVTVEAFFEMPGAMETAHPRLRQLLDLYFNQRSAN